MPVPESYSRLTMVPKDALGDAHEAMLEAMEPETETSKPVVEELETKENITPEENSDREEELNDIPEPLKTPPAVSVLIEPQKEQLASITNFADPAIYTNIIQFLEAINLNDLVDDLSLNGADSLPNVRRRIAQHVGIAPRDTRVDRMLRLALRLLPQNNGDDLFKSELLAQIGGNTKAMKRWMRARLENRHSGSSDIFLDDALNLGKALQRIPGPGFPLSLEADEYELPDADDIGRLEYEVKQLIAHMNLPSAGGIRVES
jgi:hypothetical protein